MTAENGEIALELILHGVQQHNTPSSEDTGSGGLSLDGVGAAPGSTSNLGLVGEGEDIVVDDSEQVRARRADDGS